MSAEINAAGALVHVADALPPVLAHRSTLVQVLANLLGNAIKFVESGQVPQVSVGAERHDRRVRITVEDNGIGIAPAHRERIFQVFERLHGQERYPGTGIGLAIVRRGVERMGGSVAVEDGPGGGTRFVIELPAA
jgi:signal transduction histidine kinase